MSTIQSEFPLCYNSRNTHPLLSHMAFSVQYILTHTEYDTVFRVPGIVDALSLTTDQRITIDMAIQQLQQLTPYWWAVGEAAGMQRDALKEVSVLLSLLSVLCTSICSAVCGNYLIVLPCVRTLCPQDTGSLQGGCKRVICRGDAPDLRS